jgi:DNA-binding MarR family transcriptional regulator
MRNIKVRQLVITFRIAVEGVNAMSQVVSSVDAGQTYLELHHQVHRIVDQAMYSAGLSLGRAKVLMRLEAHGPMNQATLAGLLGFAPRSVTETVDVLEREGLVTRTEDPKDRRARIVSLTDSGREACATAMAVRRKTMDEIFGVLSPTERVQLVSLLTTIRTNLVQGVDCVR